MVARHERSGNVTSRDQDSWRGDGQIGDLLKGNVWRGRRNKTGNRLWLTVASLFLI